ncbi:hypothetical protein GCM10010145_60560 [Streptomyces ruber]|uniref:Uncharacterized protein n=2 Tax=Streptomyces TaxID=1883 RepID=A0A918BQC7_9ACTN|nr:hypothetical protein [Streptomyces ruber]GGQ82819.1 hypothetical protein GCM10010145_60560 [Streptomyces ruber]
MADGRQETLGRRVPADGRRARHRQPRQAGEERHEFQADVPAGRPADDDGPLDAQRAEELRDRRRLTALGAGAPGIARVVGLPVPQQVEGRQPPAAEVIGRLRVEDLAGRRVPVYEDEWRRGERSLEVGVRTGDPAGPRPGASGDARQGHGT